MTINRSCSSDSMTGPGRGCGFLDKIRGSRLSVRPSRRVRARARRVFKEPLDCNLQPGLSCDLSCSRRARRTSSLFSHAAWAAPVCGASCHVASSTGWARVSIRHNRYLCQIMGIQGSTLSGLSSPEPKKPYSLHPMPR